MDNNYLDSLGLPGTRQSDGSLDMGDSAAIFFNIAALDTTSNKENLYFDEVPIRHPDASKWWGQPDRYSRDQLIPMLVWAILRNKKDSGLIKQVYQAHKKHWFLYAWNTKGNGAMDMPSKTPDITFMEIWALWLRINKPKGYKAILWFLDLETLCGTISWKFRKDRVTRNHMLVHIAQRSDPTFISKLSFKLNNWSDLVQRWKDHVAAVGEYPTGHLFEKELLDG